MNKKLGLGLLMALVLTVGLSGCNAWQGLGKDLGRLGDKIEKAGQN